MLLTLCRFLSLTLFGVILAGCTPATPSIDINAQMTQAVETAFASIQETGIASTPDATVTSVATAVVPRTPPPLPATFTINLSDPLTSPHTYIQDTCQYLKDKWSSANSAPGTIVMVIMFHTIEKGTETASDPKNIGSGDFKKLMNGLHDMDFQAINTAQ